MKWSNNRTKLLGWTIVILLIAYFMPVSKIWKPSYSSQHNWPYGADVTRDVLTDLFPDNEVIDAELPYYNKVPTLSDDKRYLYITIDKELDLDSLERASLLSFVGKGNTAFISTHSFDYQLIDTLGLDIDNNLDWGETEFINGLYIQDVEQQFHRDTSKTYQFQANSRNIVFNKQDSVEVELIGIAFEDYEDNLVYVRVPFENGYFFLHTNPMLLTNYYVLKDEGKEYLENVVSYLPSNDVIWDEGHKMILAEKAQSPLHVIMDQKAFRWAYWLTILGLVLLFVFRIKRRQRIIPVVEPPTNDSLEFAETMGRLFYNQSNNKALALKKIKVLKQYMSTKLFMIDIAFDKEEIPALVDKTRHSQDFIVKLYNAINNVLNRSDISNGQLKILNKQINQFLEKESKI